MHISSQGRRFIEKWEELVLYVYDDKVPKRKINGVRKYPEWDGSTPVGTLTIGYGHTDAAGWPKIKLGMRVTEQEADEILDADLKPCMTAVNRLGQRLKISFTQGQYDALVSFTFNCGPGNLNKLFKGLTAANYTSSVPRRLMQYVTSKGERMQGLVNRRAGEVKLWGSNEDPEEDESMPLPSTADREDAPKPITSSKSANTSILVGGAGAGVTLSTISDGASQIRDAKSSLADLGVMDFLANAAHSPYFWIGVILVVAGGFIYWDRHRKLEEEHV